MAFALVAVPLNARLLGPEGFALAVAGTAAANILLPWLTFGSPHSIVRLVVRQDSEGSIRGLTTLSAGVASALLVIASVVAVAFPIPYAAVALAALGFEFLAVAPVQIKASAALGRKRHAEYAIWTTATAVLRLVAAAAAFGVASSGTASPSTSFVVSHLAAAALFLPCVVTWRDRGAIPPRFLLSVVNLAGTQTAARAYDDCDKLLMPYLLLAPAAGHYAATYRIMAYALVPVRAWLTALMPRLMVCADGGSVRALIKASLPTAVVIASAGTTVAGLAAWLGTEWILGPQFTVDFNVVTLLAVAFVLRSAHFLVADALYATDRDRLRLIIQGTLAVVAIGFTWLFVSLYGAIGAAAATAAMEVVALLTYATALMLPTTAAATVLQPLAPSSES